MRRERLSLALPLVLLLLPACFDSHGALPDGALPAGDGGDCRELPALVQSLSCEIGPDGAASARLVSTVGPCCALGSLSTAVRQSGTTFDIEATRSACDCCDLCRCVSPSDETVVPLGVLGPGAYLVRAGSLSCALNVPLPPPPAMCVPVEPDGYVFPTVVFSDQPFAATIASHLAAGCGCSPGLVFPGAVEPDLHIQACGCCTDCLCIDSGYEVGLVGPALWPGTHTITVPHGAMTVESMPPDRGTPLTTTSLRVVPPDPSLRPGGSRIHWIEVSATTALCCVPSQLAIRQGLGPTGEITLTPMECALDPCDCVGIPRPTSQSHALPDLPPGHHVVRSGATAVAIDVPLGP